MRKRVTADLLEPTPVAPAADFLSGGGEMGERIRAFDWASTPLGAMQTWSPALRTMLGIMLANRFPHILWWGPDYIQFYNDPYRPIPGAKHPHEVLGQPGSKCWAEIWHIIGPLVDRPFNGGPATWDDDILLEVRRHGFLEETHFTIAYSPVPDETEARGIGGVLATVHEITEKVIAERRVVVLRDLGATVGEAKTAEEACVLAAQTLEKHPRDVPFSLLYLVDAKGHARLAGTGGVESGQAISPDVLDLNVAHQQGWPFAGALTCEDLQVVENIRERFRDIPPGPWSDPPNTAVLATIPSTSQKAPCGFMVLGVSSRLKLDRFYLDFIQLVRSQIATAISKARAYEEERKRAEALAELDRAKTAFFSNISHEFRTPLTLMLGPVADLLAKSDNELDPKVKTQLELINRNALRLLRLVNTLLDFSRIEAGRVQAVFEPIDLAAFTSELASVFHAATDRAGLKLVIDCPSLEVPVYVDREMWEKVVLNLISNAFKFTFSGEIKISLKTLDGRVHLRVSDTGVGIASSELPRIFERFHRIPMTRSRTHEGSGIGLALVQELVKLHGGEVRAESQPGRGSTFIVSLPLGKEHLSAEQVGGRRSLASTSVGAVPFVEEALRWLPEATSMEETELLARETVPTLLLPGPDSHLRARIIIADDNADLRQYLARILAEHYEVKTVGDGAAALTAAQECRPDLVLSDIMMPNLDGFGLLRKLRADESLKTVPVIFLSARAGEESRVEGLEQGADDYLAKPFSARELLARVATHLEMARLRKQSEGALRQRTEQFETVINKAPIGVYLVDADFRILQLNPVARPVFGNDVNPIGRNFDEIIRAMWRKESADEIVNLFRHTLETGESYENPDFSGYRIDRKTLEHYEWRIDRILLPDARHGVVCYFRDIAQRKQAAARLQADVAALTRMHGLSRRILRAGGLKPLLQEVMDAAIAIVGAERGTLQLFEEDSLRIVAHHGHQRPFLEYFNKAESRASVCGEASKRSQRVVVPDVQNSPLFAGTQSLEILTAAGVRAVQSTPLTSRAGVLLGILTTQWSKPYTPDEHDLWRIDLLVRQAADLIEQARTEKAIRQGEERFRMARNAAQLGIHDWDIVSGSVQWDPRTRELWGVSADVPITYDLFKAGLHPDDLEKTQAAVDRALDPKGDGNYYAEYRVVHAMDGHVRWVAATGHVTFDNGRAVRLVGTVQDITQRKEFQAELERLVAMRTKSLQETTDQLNAFCYSIAHDLKAPIRTQVSFANLLLEDFGTQLGPQGIDFLTRMREAAQRQGRLVNDLVTHMSLNRAELPLEPVELAGTIDAVCADLHSEIQSNQAHIQNHGLNGVVLANPSSLHLVLSNLLSNAIKFVAPGTQPEVTLWTEVRTDDENTRYVRLWVQDNGIGIPARSQEKIFGVFERLHPRERYPGTGIGLAIVKRAVERMNGRVGVESQPGAGSRFWVELQAG